jgi:hypothetical protein
MEIPMVVARAARWSRGSDRPDPGPPVSLLGTREQYPYYFPSPASRGHPIPYVDEGEEGDEDSDTDSDIAERSRAQRRRQNCAHRPA